MLDGLLETKLLQLPEWRRADTDNPCQRAPNAAQPQHRQHNRDDAHDVACDSHPALVGVAEARADGVHRVFAEDPRQDAQYQRQRQATKPDARRQQRHQRDNPQYEARYRACARRLLHTVPLCMQYTLLLEEGKRDLAVPE